ncbi:MAG: hypothetical protein JST28_11480 [Acidobacteria bacterium]|nr:hypothetical protein [Acidobacteriota bacterium]
MLTRSFWSAFLAMPLTVAAGAQAVTADSNGAPPAVVNAKSAFVANGGADGGLFPEPFSGDPNRGYFASLKALRATRTLEVADDPGQADLILEIHLAAPMGPTHASKELGSADALPFFKLTIYDRRTHFLLWTITEPIEIAHLQKTHDKNFDEALAHVVDDFQALSKPGAGSLYPHPPARQSNWKF